MNTNEIKTTNISKNLTTKIINIKFNNKIDKIMINSNDTYDTFLDKFNIQPKELIICQKKIDKQIPFFDNFIDDEIINVGIKLR